MAELEETKGMKIFRKNYQYFNDYFQRYNITFKVQNETVISNGETFKYKELLKQIKFKWDGQRKYWYIKKEKWTKKDFSTIMYGLHQSIDETENEILQYIKSVQNPFLSKLLIKIFEDDKYKKQFYIAPGAKTIHHAYKGGLAEHSLQLLKDSLKLASNYNYVDLNRDLLIAGSLLHDLGKIDCYKVTAEGIETTSYINNFDHIVLGISIVSRYSESLIRTDEDNEIFEHLIQIITSHHNLQEWGSPKPPMSPEAWIIHTTDQLSSKIGGGEKLKSNFRRE